jgi:hypothetical protein
MERVLTAETGSINFSTVGFRLAARDFLTCSHSYRPEKFSIAPYFLCCRAIELALKALHLETSTQADVKKRLGHKLLAAYRMLPERLHMLTVPEVELLTAVSELYAGKRFEYVQPGDAAHAFSSFPDLEVLSALAARVVEMTA